MQDNVFSNCVFFQSRPLDQFRGVLGCFFFVNFRTNDLAAVDIHDEVQVIPCAPDGTGKISDVPAPHFFWCGRAVWRRSTFGCLFRPRTSFQEFMLTQQSVRCGSRSKVKSVVSQGRNGRFRRKVAIQRQVESVEKCFLLLLAQSGWSVRMRRAFPAITRWVMAPAFKSTDADVKGLTSTAKSCSMRLCFFYERDGLLAI